MPNYQNVMTTCQRCLPLAAARSFLVTHLADHEALGYRLDEDLVETLKAATGISDEELTKKVAAKVRKFRREMQAY